MTLAIAVEEAGDTADGLAQIVLVRQEYHAEVIRIGPIEATPLHQQHALGVQQFEDETLIVVDRIHRGVELRKQV